MARLDPVGTSAGKRRRAEGASADQRDDELSSRVAGVLDEHDAVRLEQLAGRHPYLRRMIMDALERNVDDKEEHVVAVEDALLRLFQAEVEVALSTVRKISKSCLS